MSDKQFLAWFLIIALPAFLLAPVGLLHSLGLLAQVHQRTLGPALLPAEEYVIVLHADAYPGSGRKTLALMDIGLINGTASSTDLMLGYVAMQQFHRSTKSDQYPEGELIRVTRISRLDDEHATWQLDTIRIRRFRLKTVRRDDSSGVLFGRVEWLASA